MKKNKGGFTGGDAGMVALNKALDYWDSLGDHAAEFCVVQLPHRGSSWSKVQDMILPSF